MSAIRDSRDYMFDVDFFKYVEIFIKHKWFIIVFCVSAVITSLALTYIFSEKYRATASIFYRPVERSLVRQKSADAFGSPAPASPFTTISQTINDALKSDAILSEVVKELHLDQEVRPQYDSIFDKWYQESKKFVKKRLLEIWTILKFGKLYEVPPEIQAIKELRENIDLKSTKDSYIYLLISTDKYPERAAQIVNVTAKHLTVWVKKQDTSTAGNRQKTLSAQIEQKGRELASLLSRKEYLLQEEGYYSVAEEMQTGVDNVYKLEAEQSRLAAEIKGVRARIKELKKNISNSNVGAIAPDDLKRIKSDKLFAQVSLQELAAQKASIDSAVKNAQARLSQLNTLKKTIDEISIKIEVASRDYTTLNDLFIEAQDHTENDATEVRVMHEAYVPSKPISPIKIYHVGLTAFLAFFFSSGLVYVFAFFNIRIFFHSYKPKARRKEAQGPINSGGRNTNAETI